VENTVSNAIGDVTVEAADCGLVVENMGENVAATLG
jgi:hypothetical protein